MFSQKIKEMERKRLNPSEFNPSVPFFHLKGLREIRAVHRIAVNPGTTVK